LAKTALRLKEDGVLPARCETAVPFVLIGHPKLFNSHNQRQLEHLLHFIQRHPDKYRFGGYGDFLENG
jgi:hypothetical protein